jgi:two-component system CitB family response regulator
VIDVVVADDDFRVAEVHAAFVEGIRGFRVVGRTHTAAAALDVVGRLRPALVLLDLYLPDASGLEVLQRLRALPGGGPDVVVLTAARESAAVRTAIRAGALHYLIKPVDFSALREQLEAYAQLQARHARARELDQQEVDELFGLLRTAPAALPAAARSPTARRIVAVLREAPDGLMAVDVADAVGISRATAQRHLSTLVRAGVLDLALDYGALGRPRHRYRMGVPAAGRLRR